MSRITVIDKEDEDNFRILLDEIESNYLDAHMMAGGTEIKMSRTKEALKVLRYFLLRETDESQ